MKPSKTPREELIKGFQETVNKKNNKLFLLFGGAIFLTLLFSIYFLNFQKHLSIPVGQVSFLVRKDTQLYLFLFLVISLISFIAHVKRTKILNKSEATEFPNRNLLEKKKEALFSFLTTKGFVISNEYELTYNRLPVFYDHFFVKKLIFAFSLKNERLKLVEKLEGFLFNGYFLQETDFKTPNPQKIIQGKTGDSTEKINLIAQIKTIVRQHKNLSGFLSINGTSARLEIYDFSDLKASSSTERAGIDELLKRLLS